MSLAERNTTRDATGAFVLGLATIVGCAFD
jgi:hypothetical protein